jgi:hypothetical protein
MFTQNITMHEETKNIALKFGTYLYRNLPLCSVSYAVRHENVGECRFSPTFLNFGTRWR